MARLLGRLRHGLLIQEFLDRLEAAGVVCMPYLVMVDAMAHVPDVPQPPGYRMRILGPEDAKHIVAISARPRTVDSVERLLSEMRCYGAFQGEALAGYTWSRITSVPVPGAGTALFDLAADEAYLLDMYVAPAHRGARLAPWLRVGVLRELAREGRTTCYSISTIFNRSSRRFKARFGAQRRELRICLQLRIGPLRGIDLRLARWGAGLRAPAIRRIPSAWERAKNG